MFALWLVVVNALDDTVKFPVYNACLVTRTFEMKPKNGCGDAVCLV